MSSYIVEYQHPGLGFRNSSRWGDVDDARDYAEGLPAEWFPAIKLSSGYPEIFRHCGPKDDTNPAQAIGGRCFHCGKRLTVADARKLQESR